VNGLNSKNNIKGSLSIKEAHEEFSEAPINGIAVSSYNFSEAALNSIRITDQERVMPGSSALEGATGGEG
jgi:hypothetical protein